jgi:riboflavin synthase
MFTGLVEALAEVADVADDAHGRRLTLRWDAADQLNVGESVAVNGVCLTVIHTSPPRFALEAGPETLAKTNLGALRPGSRANLERALRAGDRLGGHWVQGHVDGVGVLAKRLRQGEWETVWFQCPASLAMQMVEKGSVAVDGVSLTVVEALADRFSVALIPHTLAATTLGFKQPGDTVNLETDILGKYVARYLQQILPPSTLGG